MNRDKCLNYPQFQDMIGQKGPPMKLISTIWARQIQLRHTDMRTNTVQV